MEKQYSAGNSLELIVGERNSKAIMSAQEYSATSERFRSAVKDLQDIKRNVAKYLETEETFLNASGIGNKITAIAKIGAIFARKDPLSYSLGKQMTHLLGVFGAYSTRLEDVVVEVRDEFNGVETHLNELLGAQKDIGSLIESQKADLVVKEAAYNSAEAEYQSEMQTNSENGKTQSFKVLELRENSLAKKRELEECERKLSGLIMSYNIAENTAQTLIAYRPTAETTLKDAEGTASSLREVQEKLGPLFKYVSAAAQVTELHARGVNAYMAIRAITNAMLPAVARVSQQTSQMRDAAMVGSSFIEDGTIQALKAIGSEVQEYDNSGRRKLLSRFDTQNMLTSRNDEVIDAEVEVKDN